MIIVADTTFKVISSFAITNSPRANESPYLKSLFNQVLHLYRLVTLMTADAAFISRENCETIGSAGAVPRMFPRKNITYWGPDPWREMIMNSYMILRNGWNNTTCAR
ncbi:MAG: hypothetical protein JRN10_07810 [Nitrososphaerota archaeon]|nr:hypothetical protein [Nitrososphaerota archaeon]MDG6931124.1 hypothetical protein [Nitrososphaerota archaeon]